MISSLDENLVREALNALNDPKVLSTSPLVELFGLEQQQNPARALQEVLQESIEAFHPASEADHEDRTYRILHDRYIVRLTQFAVAHELGISPRHLRRAQEEAISALRHYLVLRFDLDEEEPRESTSFPLKHADSAEMNREMAWLADHQGDQTCDVGAVLKEAISLAKELSDEAHVQLRLTAEQSRSSAAMPHTVAKQVVLNLLGALVQGMPTGSRVDVLARERQDRLVITLLAHGISRASWAKQDSLASAMSVSRRLLQTFGGSLVSSGLVDVLVIKIKIPCGQRQVTVLAIEDNEDTLELWKRYVQNTRFSLVAEPVSRKAMARALSLHPDIIVLDVMLEDTDGWEVLAQLRRHGDTAHIPVIICTVLPQRSLAESLGASDFIQKPTTGREFRAALERQSSPSCEVVKSQ